MDILKYPLNEFPIILHSGRSTNDNFYLSKLLYLLIQIQKLMEYPLHLGFLYKQHLCLQLKTIMKEIKHYILVTYISKIIIPFKIKIITPEWTSFISFKKGIK